jgi:tetratricopeptide (TPR) repeat protein
MGNRTSHVDDHFITRAIAQEFEAVPATQPAREDWEQTLEVTREEAARSHGEAAFIMQDFNATKRPFALFLRGFETEAFNYLTPEQTSGGRKVITAVAGPSRIEQKLSAALGGRIKTLSVANPAQMLTSRASFPRLLLPNEGWEALVQNVVEHAHFIVMDCSTLAPGVMRELEMIRTANRQSATVIVLPPPEAHDLGEDTLQRAAEIFGAAVIRRPRPSKVNSEFSTFRRIASEDGIAFDHLDDSPFFSDLLASAAEAAAAASPFDSIAQATRLSNEGVSLFNDKQYTQAMNLYQQAIVLRRHIDDRSGLLTSLLNIGVLYVDVNQPADALASFDEGLTLARELNRPGDEGLLGSYIGMTYKQLGQHEKAKQWLAGAYHLLSAHAEPECVENTLKMLCEVFQTLQDGDGMLAVLGELRAYHRRRGDQAGELRATLLLGTTYSSAGHLAEASQRFQEGVRLSRLLSDHEREELCRAMLERIATAAAGLGAGSSHVITDGKV